MLNIVPEAFYIVENPCDDFVVSIEGPFATEQEVWAALAVEWRSCPGAEQLLLSASGRWLLETACLDCDEITPVRVDRMVECP